MFEVNYKKKKKKNLIYKKKLNISEGNQKVEGANYFLDYSTMSHRNITQHIIFYNQMKLMQ